MSPVLLLTLVPLLGGWAVMHRQSLKPGWGKVRLTEFQVAAHRMKRGMQAVAAAFDQMKPAIDDLSRALQKLSSSR